MSGFMDEQQLAASMSMQAALPLHNGCSNWEALIAPWRGMPLPSVVAKITDLLNGKLIGQKCKFCEHVWEATDTVVLVAMAAKKKSNVIEVVERTGGLEL